MTVMGAATGLRLNVTMTGLQHAAKATRIRAMKFYRAIIVLMTTHRRWAV